jgi:hypothetical protein
MALSTGYTTIKKTVLKLFNKWQETGSVSDKRNDA